MAAACFVEALIRGGQEHAIRLRQFPKIDDRLLPPQQSGRLGLILDLMFLTRQADPLAKKKGSQVHSSHPPLWPFASPRCPGPAQDLLSPRRQPPSICSSDSQKLSSNQKSPHPRGEAGEKGSARARRGGFRHAPSQLNQRFALSVVGLDVPIPQVDGSICRLRSPMASAAMRLLPKERNLRRSDPPSRRFPSCAGSGWPRRRCSTAC
eukprot:scaffold835_cov226-Pinguiococcus_pyrenoidosus.AAC.1